MDSRKVRQLARRKWITDGVDERGSESVRFQFCEARGRNGEGGGSDAMEQCGSGIVGRRDVRCGATR